MNMNQRRRSLKIKKLRYFGLCKYTNREIAANKNDIMIKDHMIKTCTLIDMALPSDRDTSSKITGKLQMNLEIELKQSEWGE